MFKRKQQVRSLLTVAVPVIAVVFTYMTLPKKSAPVAVPRTSNLVAPTQQDPHKIREWIASKSRLLEELLENRIDFDQAIEGFREITENETHVKAGLQAVYGPRSMEELAALNVIRYLENSPDDPRAVARYPEARCEFESRFGPQVWILGDYGICPYPVE